MKPHQLFLFVLLMMVFSGLSFAETPEERRALWDRGPQTIDVSAYPAPLQANYALFSTKCSQCHNLARPINSDFALPAEWERYIKRMMRKPGSGISKDDGKKIFDFVVYDTTIRKAALLQEKLNALSPEEKKAQEDKIAEIKSKYGS